MKVFSILSLLLFTSCGKNCEVLASKTDGKTTMSSLLCKTDVSKQTKTEVTQCIEDFGRFKCISFTGEME